MKYRKNKSWALIGALVPNKARGGHLNKLPLCQYIMSCKSIFCNRTMPNRFTQMCARFCTSLFEIESCRHFFPKCGPYLDRLKTNTPLSKYYKEGESMIIAELDIANKLYHFLCVQISATICQLKLNIKDKMISHVI